MAKRAFDLESIKSRREDYTRWIKEAEQAETVEERINRKAFCFAGWPTPLDDINQLIEEIERMQKEADAMREYISAVSE